jgi:F-type H+-transporting ATPase subunit b
MLVTASSPESGHQHIWREQMEIDARAIAMVAGQAITFLLFVLILKALAWKPILKMLDERKERIQEEFDTIAKLKEDVESLKSDYEGRVSVIEEEAREKIQEAVKEGRRVADEISERAREEARERIEKSKQMIQLEIEKARVQIKEDVIKIAMEVSELAIRERLDEDKHRNLVNHFIDELNSQN